MEPEISNTVTPRLDKGEGESMVVVVGLPGQAGSLGYSAFPTALLPAVPPVRHLGDVDEL
jgi:hypothetical protein